MFNKYSYNSNDSSFDANITIEENKAPTDESIRLLSEMQEKARDSIVDSYTLSDNEINGNIVVFKDQLTSEYVIYTRFSLNGKKYKFDDRFRSYETKLFNAKELLISKMRDAIYNELVKNLSYNNELGVWEG